MNRCCQDYGVRDWLRIAYRNARDFSDDLSTQCGAVLVPKDNPGQLVFGANHFPKGVQVNIARLTERPDKYLYVEHAERDCILSAALRGVATLDATLYAPWFACADCARAIIGAGIKRVVGHHSTFERTPDRWLGSIAIGDIMLDEAGVIREYYVGKLFEDGEVFGEDPDLVFEVLFNGELWTP